MTDNQSEGTMGNFTNNPRYVCRSLEWYTVLPLVQWKLLMWDIHPRRFNEMFKVSSSKNVDIAKQE